jgi:hypothetical protein
MRGPLHDSEPLRLAEAPPHPRRILVFRLPRGPLPASGARCAEEVLGAYPAIASSLRRVVAGPNAPITTNTTTMAAAMKLNTPVVP